MSAITSDMDETARLVHMEQEEAGVRDIRDYHRRMSEEVGASLGQSMELWSKYRGTDRLGPTHDIETGESLTRMRMLARNRRR